MALLSSNIQLAEECLVRAADLPGLLLLYTSTGHAMGLERLAELAKAKGKLNIAFICFFLRGQTSECLQLLLDAERSPEAAFLLAQHGFLTRDEWRARETAVGSRATARIGCCSSATAAQISARDVASSASYAAPLLPRARAPQ